MSKRLAAWWWVDRWRKSTAYTDMTLAEQGAYRNLLDELWLRGGVLPTDDRILGKIAGDQTEWHRVKHQVLTRFRLTPEGYRNDTHDEVAGETTAIIERQRAKGRKRAAIASRAPAGTFTSQPAAYQPEHQPADQPTHQPTHQPLTSRNTSRATSLPSPSPSPSQSPDRKKQEAPVGAVMPPVVPDWIPTDAWSDFLDARKRSRSAMTHRAQELAIGALGRLRAAGHDPRAVIEQSILNGWRGLFPVRSSSDSPGNGTGLHAGEKTAAASREAMQRAEERERRLQVARAVGDT